MRSSDRFSRSVSGLALATLVAAGTALAQPKDVVETATADAQLKTFVKAVQAAGLVEELKKPGPFTVFAPTDEAFAKIPKEQLDALMKDKAKLRELLLKHVVSGKTMAADVAKMPAVKSIQGEPIGIKNANGVTVNSAKVVRADIAASNGVIHVIDAVMKPADIVDTLAAAGNFNSLVKAIGASDVVGTLHGPGPVTFFAPTDEAFKALGSLDTLQKDPAKLTNVLSYHLTTGSHTVAQLLLDKTLRTAMGQSLAFTGDKASVTINGKVKITKADVMAGNGVIHVIDVVLIPQAQ